MIKMNRNCGCFKRFTSSQASLYGKYHVKCFADNAKVHHLEFDSLVRSIDIKVLQKGYTNLSQNWTKSFSPNTRSAEVKQTFVSSISTHQTSSKHRSTYRPKQHLRWTCQETAPNRAWNTKLGKTVALSVMPHYCLTAADGRCTHVSLFITLMLQTHPRAVQHIRDPFEMDCILSITRTPGFVCWLVGWLAGWQNA